MKRTKPTQAGAKHPRRRRRSSTASAKQLLSKLDRIFQKWALKEVAGLLIALWNKILAVGFLLYILRYKLEIGKYFTSLTDIISDRTALYTFISEKWETLVLGTVFLITYVLLTKDSAQWKEQAEKCFSVDNVPTNWTVVRARWIIAWVVISNIAIFLSLAYYTDNIAAFSALFALHHFNAVAWLYAFRWNVNYYFCAPRYMPHDNDPLKHFILERRKVMETFLCRTSNIQREALTATVYAAALLLVLANQVWWLTVYAAPHVIISVAEATNQYFSYLERRERDRDLRRIYEQEKKYSSAERRRRA